MRVRGQSLCLLCEKVCGWGAKSGEKISENPRLFDSQEYFECIAVGQASAGVTFLSLVRSLSVQKEKT